MVFKFNFKSSQRQLKNMYIPIRTACMWSKLMNICIVIIKMDNNAIQTYWSLDWLKQKP